MKLGLVKSVLPRVLRGSPAACGQTTVNRSGVSL